VSAHEEFTDIIAGLPDDEVQRIAASTPEEYRPEAIAFAQSILRQRNLEPKPPPAPVPHRRAKSLAILKWGAAGFAVLGALVAVNALMARNGDSRPLTSGAEFLVVAVVAWGAWLLETILLRLNGSPSGADEGRWIGTLLVAFTSSLLALSKCARGEP
jgi:hypothetical protein